MDSSEGRFFRRVGSVPGKVRYMGSPACAPDVLAFDQSQTRFGGGRSCPRSYTSNGIGSCRNQLPDFSTMPCRPTHFLAHFLRSLGEELKATEKDAKTQLNEFVMSLLGRPVQKASRRAGQSSSCPAFRPLGRSDVSQGLA